MSDHYPLLMISGYVPNMKQKGNVLEFKYRDCNLTSYQLINNHLSRQNWESLNPSTVDAAFETFNSTVSEIMNIYAPERTARIPGKKVIREPWVTKGILKSSDTLDKLYMRKLKYPPEHENHTRYKKYRNLFNTIKRKMKQSHYSTLLETYKSDIKRHGRY